MAVGGSTNAVIHLLAIAGRLRVPLSLEDFDLFARSTPLLLNLQPSGERLMADFEATGGVPALMHELRSLLHLGTVGVSGRPLGQELKPAPDQSIIRSLERPLQPAPTMVVLHGNLAPRGALIRMATASPGLRHHRGPALVFNSYQDMLERIDDPALPVKASSVLVLRNAGAVGVPGLPEWGAIPVPKKLLQAGISDILRISDSRMSGTSSGTIVLHVTPEAAVGGPLALVEDGDLIELDIEARQLTLHVPEEELARRRVSWSPPPLHRRGYPRLYAEHVLQPDEGCDFDFLRPRSDADLAFIPPIVGRS
jgi:L-arabonate dehydrase